MFHVSLTTYRLQSLDNRGLLFVFEISSHSNEELTENQLLFFFSQAQEVLTFPFPPLEGTKKQAAREKYLSYHLFPYRKMC